MSTNIYLLFINVLIGFVLVYLIRKQDIYHPESFAHMAIVTVFGGAMAIFIATAAAVLLSLLGFYQTSSVFNFFVFTGPIEEISKLIGFLFIFRFFKIHFDEPVDAAVYMSCVALGFSLIENFFYALGKPELIGLRILTATPMHIIFSSTMALVFVTNLTKEHLWKRLLKAIVIASFFHGLYDSFIFMGTGDRFLLYTIVAMALIWGKKIFGYALLNSPHRKDLLSVLRDSNQSTDKYCAHCQQESSHRIFNFRETHIDECQKCESIVLPARKAAEFLNHLLPNYIFLMGRSPSMAGQLRAIYFEFRDSKGFNAYGRFKTKEASPMIEALAEDLRKNFEAGATFSFIFGTRPLVSRENGIINTALNNRNYKTAAKVILAMFGTVAGIILFIVILIKLLS